MGAAIVRLPRPRPWPRPRPRPRRRLHPLVTLALGSASAFLAGLLVASLGHAPCRAGMWAGLSPPGPAPEGEGLGGVASAEAPPPWPRLRELLQRHLQDERIEAWVREVSAGPHGAGSERGRSLAGSVLEAMEGAGLNRVWSRPQPLPLPVRGSVSLQWVDAEGRELQRLRLDPEAFCAWSASGNATGGLVYGHYGRPQDLQLLRAQGVSIGGNLLLLRTGRGDPAGKVAAAAGAGALGVLLYPDPQDTVGPGGDPGLGGDTAVTMHVRSWVAPVRLRVGGVPPSGVFGTVRRRGGGRRLRLSVAAGTEPGTLTSVFGVLEGRLEPDCYVIVGAQRDSLGPGAAASGVGTALLLELARFFAAIGRDGFQLRRSLLFVSWDGGEFGHLGATEWLEGYPNLLHTKAAAYISLDQAVLGADRLVAKTSPTLVTLIESALSQVESPNEGGKSLLEHVTRPGRGWESDVIRPLPPQSGAFPFTAAAGVPAMEIGFVESPIGRLRSALGTMEDSVSRLPP
ncbi:transferrin receptor protein 2-like [Melopsittacus undulatus]|uniref:transferrin receptor protein 2-like n=1 Tax=Melopsittacus undulatus TaxID=13146 RepID=UPI00146D8EF7|nr:transferrin receptor protein 2-like [Melopsittacus undulatus]